MPTGTKHGYALILISATLVALLVALAIGSAAGLLDASLAPGQWFGVALLLGLGWVTAAMLVSLLFLGARLERNATLYEATSRRVRRAQSPSGARWRPLR